MSSREAWQTLEGTLLQDGVVLRELVDVSPSALFRAESSSGEPLLVRFWGKQQGDPKAIVNRHREASYLKGTGLLRCVQSGLAMSGDTPYAYAAFEAPEALLSDHLRQGVLTPEEVQSLGRDLAAALESLHANDLVYCALDPTTIARKDGRWVLSDFSQMRLTGGGYANETKRLMMTFPATPPEAFQGHVGPAWDAWSLAHVLRMCLLPPQPRKPGERLTAGPTELPPPFASVLSACTIMDPAQRCTVREIADMLQEIPAPGAPVTAAAPIIQEPPPLRSAYDSPARTRLEAEPEEPSRKRLAAMAGAGFVAVLLLYLFVNPGSGRVRQQGTQSGSPQETRSSPLPSPLDMPVSTEPASSRSSTRSRAGTDADLIGLLDRWSDAFRRRDIGAHMALYAPRVERFFLSRNVPIDQVRKTKEQALAAAGDIKRYEIENVRTKMDGATRATLSFDKTYEFAGKSPHSGKVRSELYLRKENERWSIVGERDVRVYWQRRS